MTSPGTERSRGTVLPSPSPSPPSMQGGLCSSAVVLAALPGARVYSSGISVCREFSPTEGEEQVLKGGRSWQVRRIYGGDAATSGEVE
ncbi:hypothetical protein MTO96_012205 [Rhipicephalus appendiculatus]